MITTSFFQMYSFYATGSGFGTRKQHFELRAFSGFCIWIFPIKLTYSICFPKKECQLTISGIVNCSVWFVDIYDPKRIFHEIWLNYSVHSFICEMYTLNMTTSERWQFCVRWPTKTCFTSVTKPMILSEEDELICNIVRTRYTTEIAFR